MTVWAGLQDFPGPLNVVIALTIAVIKATLVVLYFMHVRYSSRLIWVIFASALFWMGILFALTFSDTGLETGFNFTRKLFPRLDTTSHPAPQLHDYKRRSAT